MVGLVLSGFGFMVVGFIRWLGLILIVGGYV